MTAPRQHILGLSQSEIKTYLSLLGHHPVNGSQLSRHAGVRRPNIYDVLRSLKEKGLVVEANDGLYAPLPPDEFLSRMRMRVDAELSSLKERIDAVTRQGSTEYVWAIKGYEEVMGKAKEMIRSARRELYVQLYRKEARHLDPFLLKAERRGVEVKYVAMGTPLNEFELQVVHPGTQTIEKSQGGRVFDIVRDKIEILVGMFENGREDESPINWAKNHWFVMAIREGIRHDFFHYFVHKLLEKNQALTARERRMYDLVKNDAWAERFQPQ
jgi:sugar-specific transcriptional regulator TrmB